MAPTKTSGFQVEGIELLECMFRSHPETRRRDGGWAAPDITFSARGAIDHREQRIVIEATVATPPQATRRLAFELSLKVAARFTWTGDVSLNVEEFARRNASAFIWPFLRETVWNLTTRAHGVPLFLPILNLSEAQIELEDVTRKKSARASPARRHVPA